MKKVFFGGSPGVCVRGREAQQGTPRTNMSGGSSGGPRNGDRGGPGSGLRSGRGLSVVSGGGGRASASVSIMCPTATAAMVSPLCLYATPVLGIVWLIVDVRR